MARSALITGGVGFIGSHLADRLLADGWTVTAVDNLAIGRRENIAHLRGRSDFRFIPGDIVDREFLIETTRAFDVDTIFHLAAVHYIPFCNAHPYEAFRINALGTQAVADAAVANGVTKVILASTSDVYAMKDLPFVESDPVDPYTVYGTTKLTAERILRVTASMHERLSVSIARLFNVYGPRETNPHVLPAILDQLKSGSRTVKLGNLWPRRDFVYVTDVADALAGLMKVGSKFDVFNVGSGVATSIHDAVIAIVELLDQPVEAVVDPERVRPVERGCLHADISKITQTIPWRPLHTFRDGMSKWLAADRIVTPART
jgi:UDP-glucose 4-epimerase